MLTPSQADSVWQKMYGAEVRSLYFGDLASRYTRRKQIITGVSFFASSGAASMVAARLPPSFSIVSASIAAIATAYAIAIGLDKKVISMAKLQTSWSLISADLEHIWNHWYEEDAEKKLAKALALSREASQLGSTEAPIDDKAMTRWETVVRVQRGVAV